MKTSDNIPVDRDDAAALWCVELGSGSLPSDRRQAFDAWIADPENAVALQDAADLWRDIDHIAETPEVIGLRTSALQSLRKANRLRWAVRTDRRRWMAIAASVVVTGALAATWVSMQPRVRSYETGIGERQVATLADGSTVSLDADSRVEVRLLNQRRDLILVRGRARFNVARDPLRPFTVRADGQTVIATGTDFTVETLQTSVRVQLFEGHVSVVDTPAAGAGAPTASRRETRLSPGQSLIAIPGKDGTASIEVQPFEVSAGADWRQGMLAFDDEPLSTAIERVNRYARVKLAIGDTKAASARVTGVFTADDPAAFIEGVSAIHPVHAVRAGGRINLVSN